MATITSTETLIDERSNKATGPKIPPAARVPVEIPRSIPLRAFLDQTSSNESTPRIRTPAPDDHEEPGAEPSTPQGVTFRVQERWNSPKSNISKFATVLFVFLIFGMNDGSYGALVPPLQRYYGLGYTLVSLVFLAPFVGYTLAAMVIDPLHLRVGRRGVAFIASMTRMVAYVVLSVHPPYPVVVSIYTLAGFGNGLLDAGWNAFVGNLTNANELLGLMHGFYGIGATISPVIISSIVNKYNKPWWSFFYALSALCAAELVVSLSTFWEDSGTAFRNTEQGGSGVNKGRMKEALSKRVTWIISFFLLAYVGCEVSLGGWIVEFMIRVRKGDPFSSGLTATGFWLGITLGRFTLGFVTPRLGESLAISIYISLAMGLELLFWLVPQFVVSAVAIALIGFFAGPLFPAAVIACTKLLPQRLHVGAVGFSSALGGSGASVLPFAVGAIASAKGVQTLQPIILTLLGVLLALWLSLPKIPRHAHAD